MINRILIRTRVLQVAYAHLHRDEIKLRSAEEDLETCLEQTYNLYLYLLCLPVELTRYYKDLTERRSQKHFATEEERKPNMRLANNRLVAQLEACDPLQTWYHGFPLTWETHLELLRHLVEEIQASPTYAEYLASEDTFESDRKFWVQVFQRILSSDSYLAATLEESSIYWDDELTQTERYECQNEPQWEQVEETIEAARAAELYMPQRLESGNVEVVKAFVIKSLRHAAEGEPFASALLPQYRDVEDQKFASRLLHQLLVGQDRHLELIDKHIHESWERERLADMDLLLLQLAVVEFLHFPTIPTQVTINEYVELSKHYSTPKSSAFVNGILDAIAKTLKAEGRILKQ